MIITSLFVLTVTFLTLPLHFNPISLGIAVLLIALSLLTFFISTNITLISIITILVYIRGILILFSYFFSLIQNTKIYFIPLVLSSVFLGLTLILAYWKFVSPINRKIFSFVNPRLLHSFTWIMNEIKLVFLLIIILLLRMLFVEKVIGLKQKPLRVK